MNSRERTGAFPFGEKAVKIQRDRADAIASGLERRGSGVADKWNYTDSELFGSPGSFADTFGAVIPERFRNEGPRGLLLFIENSLAERKGRAIGVEMGGIAWRLFRCFSDGFFSKTTGVSLVDYTSALYFKHPKKEHDVYAYTKHSVIEGRIQDGSTYEKVRQWAIENTDSGSEAGIDLLFERLLGGWDAMPKDVTTLSSVLGQCYGMLSDVGIMFVQTPVVLNDVVKVWVREVLTHDSTLVIGFKRGTDDYSPLRASGLFIQKLPGAPKQLPFLSDKRLLELYRKGKRSERSKSA